MIYALADRDRRTAPAERLIRQGGWISVQVLNELANASQRKRHHTWERTLSILDATRRVLEVCDLTLATHERGIALARRHRLSIYDAMIVAAALESGCDTLYSEDMHAGLVVEDRLTIVNPFA